MKVCLACLLNTIIIFDMQITCREEELYGEIEDSKQIRERKELLSLVGNRSVLFDIEDEE